MAREAGNIELEGVAELTPTELRMLFSDLPVALIIVDAATRTVRSANRAAREILQRWTGREEIEGATLPGSKDGSHPWQLHRVLAGERVVREIHRLSLLGPETRVELSALALRDEDGRMVAAAIAFADVAEYERTRRVDAEFIDNAAHQLRSPVASIASSVAALQAGARDDPRELERFLGHVARESGRLGGLVDSLLALAGLQHGLVPPHVELIGLRALIADVVADLELDDAEVIVDCDPRLAVLSDRGLLAQALGNVLANAAERTIGAVRIAAQLAGSNIILDVADSGQGVPEELRERIFERFFSLPGRTRRGSGLGLAIAKAAAEAAHGRLELLPAQPGEGATFRFTVPGARLL